MDFDRLRHDTRAYHDRIEENDIDPDDGNSWLCSVCNLPIFSTPFIKYDEGDDDGGGGGGGSSSKVFYLHNDCANLPKELKGSDLHPQKTLFLDKRTSSIISYQMKTGKRASSTITCDKCNAVCGTMVYLCPDDLCCAVFDVLCALAIRIVHRSHRHRLMAIRPGSDASFICGACGAQHQPGLSWAHPLSLAYMCNACSFWIHPHCASLPNAILLQHQHQHPLVLDYGRPDSSKRHQDPCYCAICEGVIASMGVYSCTKCRYHVHIMCAVSDPHSFKPALFREARLLDVTRLPIPDEHSSTIRYIRDSTTIITEGGISSGGSSDEGHYDELHEHPLIFHDENGDDHPSHLCNACVQPISAPFYRCSECPDFFLHNCCAHLPPTLTRHPAHHDEDHPLSLFPKAPSNIPFISTFRCSCCSRTCNGFAYSCKKCDDFHVDVMCALMPASITHDIHANTHILYLSFNPRATVDLMITLHLGRFKQLMKKCDSCGLFLGNLSYECGNCPNFKLHARCALVPNTVRHRYDQHPLKLITTISQISQQAEMQQFCEICERDIGNISCWYYSCDECEQSFHIDCIPCLDEFSKIKFGATIIHVECHDCPLTLIRAPTVRGYRCGYCRKTFRPAYYDLAFECSKCYFRIHNYCAEKVLKKVE